MLQGEKVLVAGATGQVALPLTLALAGDNDVWATVVNWAGEDAVSIEDWCAYLGELTGLEPTFRPTDRTIASVAVDLTRMHDLVGHAKVPWQEGFARMVAARRVSTAGRGRT